MTSSAIPPDVQHVEEALKRLVRALQRGASSVACHRLWSTFIRVRDGNKCLACATTRGLAAHHIFRQSFFAKARFEPGNGITLCAKCHRCAHAGFNGKPDFQLPMDAQGGEKIEDISLMLGLLLADGKERGLLSDDWYHFSDSTLGTLKLLQGFHPGTPFPGLRLEQALGIWIETPRQLRDAVMLSNGLTPPDVPMGGGMCVVFGGRAGEPEADRHDGPETS